jgi:hypothetical protein
MRKITYLFALCLMAVLSQSCSPELRPFTANIYKEGGWSDSELKRIQFYLSDDIIIHRKITEGSSEIISGSIKMVRGEKIEEVRIPRGTKGEYLFKANNDNFAIGFDATSDKRYLMFGPNPKRSGAYVLLASEWKDRRGKVRYDDKFYFTDEGGTWANLMVDMRKIKKVEVASKTVRGRRVE